MMPVSVADAKVRRSECGVDGDDLALSRVAHHPGLGDVFACDRCANGDIEHGAWIGAGQILGGGPDQRSSGGLLHG